MHYATLSPGMSSKRSQQLSSGLHLRSIHDGVMEHDSDWVATLQFRCQGLSPLLTSKAHAFAMGKPILVDRQLRQSGCAQWSSARFP